MQAGAPGGDDASGDASASTAVAVVTPAPAPGMPSAHPAPSRLAPAVTAVDSAEATPVEDESAAAAAAGGGGSAVAAAAREDESAVAAAAREDESAVATAARGRHVGKPARGVPARPTINAQPKTNKVPTTGTSAGFQGFNV